MQGLHLDDILFAKRTDYIRLTAITYQSFGLDKKIDNLLSKIVGFFVFTAQNSNSSSNNEISLCDMK